jgi:hypothetical protein
MKLKITTIIFFLSVILFSCEEDNENKGTNDSTTEGSTTPKKYVTNVFDYQFAPGQFYRLAKKPDWINGDSTTSDIHIGGWGGYIELGFDHDVLNCEGKDIIVYCGNSPSPEPGIIYVMNDVNGNGLPDDEWYEIKGSEVNHPDYIRDYRLTYFKPESADANIRWEDNQGNSGELISYNSSTSAWWWDSNTTSVTFEGVRLPNAYFNAATEPNSSNWLVYPDLFKYGYAENGTASNREPADDYDPELKGNLIDISDAIDKAGNPVNLEKIRFVKIQTGVFQRAGWLNEVSTEITGVGDLSLIKQ